MDKARMLPKEAIDQFRKIYKRKFGEELNFDQAEIRANNFINLFYLITEGRKDENKYEKFHNNTKRVV